MSEHKLLRSGLPASDANASSSVQKDFSFFANAQKPKIF